MEIFDEILNKKELQDEPPVIIDIGASGFLPSEWSSFAKYAICIAFDADDREINYIVQEKSDYKKLHLYNAIVVHDNSKNKEMDFYLTSSPYSSSLLEPDLEKLNDWGNNSELFKINEIIKLKTVCLSNIVKELKLKHIDWFKTDSQGTDLRLFKSLDKKIIDKVLVADFEPGILDAYKNEDKLVDVIKYFEDKDFWMNDIEIKGFARMKKDIYYEKYINMSGKDIYQTIKKSPCWAEVSFMNTISNFELFNKRDLLLAWIFSVIKKQYGFALEISKKGVGKYSDEIFTKMDKYIIDLVKNIRNKPGLLIKRFIKNLFTKKK